MRIEPESADAAAHIRAIADVIIAHGGFIADDLTVHERGGDLWCAIGAEVHRPGRVLLRYSPEPRVPVSRIRWRETDRGPEPVGTLRRLSDPQRRLLDHWLALVIELDQLTLVRQRYPVVAITDPALRAHLAKARYPEFLTAPRADEAVRQLLLRCTIERGERLLVPLKCFVNHDPNGASQQPMPGWVAVVSTESSDDQQTFENYGDLDAIDLAVRFGYFAGAPSVVHALPGISFGDAATPGLRIRTRPPRVSIEPTVADGEPVPELSQLTLGPADPHARCAPGC